jgi:DNA-binding MarR family transcriptional regulator
MPDLFVGELSKMKLFDLLKPLLTGKKTGMVVIKGKETGEIYLESGNIIHAQTAQFSGEDAFYTMMGWKTGRSTFEPDVSPKEKTILIPSEQLLLNWSYRKQEWEKIRGVIPSSNEIFRLSLQKNLEDKHIRGDQWNVLALASGMRRVFEIAEMLGWDEFKTSKTIYQLVQAGLLEKGEEPKPPKKKYVSVKRDFFPMIENELKKVMGPVAPFVIEDKLVEFGEVKDSFPQDQAEPFVEAISEEISHDLKRKEFIRVMKEFLSQEGQS